jgi:phage tail protein X
LQTSTPLKKGKTETKAIATVNVEKGTTLNALAKRHYGITDLLVLDLILQANPRITDPHLLQVNQKVELPAISAASFLLPASGQGYKIIVGTFSQREAAGRFGNDPVLKGKNIETVARPVSTQQTWYRVLAGTFQTEEEALQAIRGVRNIERIVGIAERTARTQ